MRDAAVRRVLAWYLHTVVAMATMVSPHRVPGPARSAASRVEPLSFQSLDEALDWCEIERTNLVAATRQAAASGLHALAWQLPVAALSFFNRRTYWADWVKTHRIALASVRLLGDRAARPGAQQSGHGLSPAGVMDEAARVLRAGPGHPPRGR